MFDIIKINFKYFVKSTIKFTTYVYAFLGFIGTWAPLYEVFPAVKSLKCSIIILLVIGFISFLYAVMRFCYNKRFKIFEVNNNHALYLQYGDIFDEKIVLHPEERRNIIIPVNRCFDTIVDNELIAEKTIHGKAFKRLYEAGTYTEAILNQFIQSKLSKIEYDELNFQEKPRGNVKRFPVGTIVNIEALENKEHYFLLALSYFDNNLKARTSMQDYAKAVQLLIEACNTESEGYPIVIPLIGAGLSRIKKEQSDILSYLISAFKLNRAEINCDIHIVVCADVKNKIPITNFI